ncbi:Holliday junction resolvase RuvX [Buchnera aphidicola (Pseudoregma panicola)]|uniref:Holliday junction resolvase RuvX n=1 Tax=Buchnera aphidicola TaxID=9 RepID=UPI0031B6F1AB
MNYISFDYGTKNIGVAVGQKITNTGNILNSIKIKNKNIYWKEIEKIIKLWNPKSIIVGLPLNMDGTEQKFTKKTKIFAFKISKKFNIRVHMHDERLSTIEAKRILFKKGFNNLTKNKINSTSALIILESWFLKVFYKKK